MISNYQEIYEKPNNTQLHSCKKYFPFWEPGKRFFCEVKVLCTVTLPIVRTNFYARASNLLDLEKISNPIS